MEINKSRQRLFIQSLLYQESQPASLTFGKDSKAGRGMGKLYSGRKGWLQVYHDWRLFAQGSWSIVCDWLKVHIWLSLVDPEFEMRVKF